MTYHILSSSQKNKHWIFAFYGFGQQANVFESLAKMCNDKYGFVVIDLPYNTYEKAESKSFFTEKIKKIITENNIEKITGISYSMGSRYNLILAELLPSFLQKIILIAPDGVKINFWNRVATSTILGHVLFKYFMTHPKIYLGVLHFVYKIKLLPSSLYAFSKWHVRNMEQCSKVYNSWMNMKEMIPDLKKIKENTEVFSIPLTAIFGKNDFVINSSCMTKLKKEIPNTEIKIIEKGHNLLDEDLFQHIASDL